MYGPVRTVVWEGRSREAPPYPYCPGELSHGFEKRVPAGYEAPFLDSANALFLPELLQQRENPLTEPIPVGGAVEPQLS